MNTALRTDAPSVEDLFAPFAPAPDLPSYELIPPGDLPHPYDALLAHNHHMTVTVEVHYGDLVQVRVLDRRQEGDFYTRKILLALEDSGRVVQFGIVRVHLGLVSAPVREAIVAGRTPFGRILIQHNVLRRIEPTAFLRVHPGPAQMAWFGLTEPRPLYGRLAFIHCDEKPAVELLEIVAPTREGGGDAFLPE